MRHIRYIIWGLFFSFLFIGCDNTTETPVQPSTITDIATEPLPGSIKITWTKNEPVTYEYIRVSYFDHLTKSDMVRLASSYSDSILIPNTRAKYGDYNFTLLPVSVTKTEGTAMQVTGKSGPAPVTISKLGSEKLSLTPECLFTDAQEPSEGPIADLIDGNNNTFFHAAWSVDYGPLPHYIVVKLPHKVRGMSFSYITRNHENGGNHPKRMSVYVSNTFDLSLYDLSEATLVEELSNLPNGAMKEYSSSDYIFNEEYEYVWFQVHETHGDTKFFALSELSISELILKVVDPEASE